MTKRATRAAQSATAPVHTKAMAAIWVHPHFAESSADKIAALAYEQADAMIAARAAKSTPTKEEV